MIHASYATDYISQRIKELIQANHLKGKLEKSKSSISIYLRVKDENLPPPKYFRGSNHHPWLSNLLKRNWKPWESRNICIEFLEDRFDKNGNLIDNRWNDGVRQNRDGTIKPFYIEVFLYTAANLDDKDIPIIFEALKSFLFTGKFVDPFVKTPKAAKPVVRYSKIKPSIDALYTNITMDKEGNPMTVRGHGADYVSESHISNVRKPLSNIEVIRRLLIFEDDMED